MTGPEVGISVIEMDNVHQASYHQSFSKEVTCESHGIDSCAVINYREYGFWLLLKPVSSGFSGHILPQQI